MRLNIPEKKLPLTSRRVPHFYAVGVELASDPREICLAEWVFRRLTKVSDLSTLFFVRPPSIAQVLCINPISQSYKKPVTCSICVLTMSLSTERNLGAKVCQLGSQQPLNWKFCRLRRRDGEGSSISLRKSTKWKKYVLSPKGMA